MSQVRSNKRDILSNLWSFLYKCSIVLKKMCRIFLFELNIVQYKAWTAHVDKYLPVYKFNDGIYWRYKMAVITTFVREFYILQIVSL